MFYLWELFCMQEQLMTLLPETTRMQENVQKRLAECRGWRDTLEEIYQEYGVTIAMYEFCYLYVGSENYCIGDVVRIRRKMLGLSQKKLCENLCDERTLSRLERNKSKPQREVVQCLFDRLNLSTELCRTELVTDSKEAISKYEELCRECMNWNFKQVQILLDELKTLISVEIPSNRQALLRNEVLNLYNQKKLKKQEYIEKMKRVLECTVPYSSITKPGIKYFTNEEIVCIQNITLDIGWTYKEMQECVDTLVGLCESAKYPANYIRLYEFIMATASSYLGDKGDYEYSNQIKHSIIEMSLKYRRIRSIDSALYGLLWNSEQKKKNSSKEIDNFSEKELIKCIYMSALCKNMYRKTIYETKLKSVSIKAVGNKSNPLIPN